MSKIFLFIMIAVFVLFFIVPEANGKRNTLRPPIEDYKVIFRTSFPDLEREVKKHIENGYEPVGGVSINESQCAQAMVYYKKN